jgi:Phage integrase family
MKQAGIEYVNEHGIADFHAAGRHSHITELIRSGVSLPEARELARHSDIRMTMRYTHIGMDDKAKAIKQLPWQRNGSDSAGSDGRKPWQAVTKSASNEPRQEITNPCESRGCSKDRHQMSPDDTITEERRARDSNPQPLARQLISNQSASHSLTLRG